MDRPLRRRAAATAALQKASIITSPDAFLEATEMNRVLMPLMPAMMVLPLLHSAVHAAPPSSSPTPQIRTYVSGTGNDNGGCTASAPCKTFQAALALTMAGGEIYVLNSAN